MVEENVIPIKKEFTVQDKEATVKMLVKVHSLLADGLFPGKYSPVLTEARGFVERLHAEALTLLESDPNYKKEDHGTETT